MNPLGGTSKHPCTSTAFVAQYRLMTSVSAKYLAKSQVINRAAALACSERPWKPPSHCDVELRLAPNLLLGCVGYQEQPANPRIKYIARRHGLLSLSRPSGVWIAPGSEENGKSTLYTTSAHLPVSSLSYTLASDSFTKTILCV